MSAVAAATLFFTYHAVGRFRQRFAPTRSFESARRELMRLSQHATPMREHTPTGEERWIAAEGPVVFIVRRDARYRLPTCLTVIPKGATDVDPAEAEQLRLLEGLQRDVTGGGR